MHLSLEVTNVHFRPNFFFEASVPSARTAVNLFLLSVHDRSRLQLLILWPGIMLLNAIPSVEPRWMRSADFIESEWYTSNTTSMLPLPWPWRICENTWSESSQNVRFSPCNLSVSPMASIIVALGWGTSSTGNTLLSRCFDNTALFVFFIVPSPFDNAQGKGPRGWDRTSRMSRFLLWAMSDHVAKQPSVSFHENRLGFSFGWFTLHCSEGLQLYFLNVLMETIHLNSLLFEFLVGMFSFLMRCQQVSGYTRRRNCPSGNAHEVGRIVSKRGFQDQCDLWSHCPERRSPAAAASVLLHDVQLLDSNGTPRQVRVPPVVCVSLLTVSSVVLSTAILANGC